MKTCQEHAPCPPGIHHERGDFRTHRQRVSVRRLNWAVARHALSDRGFNVYNCLTAIPAALKVHRHVKSHKGHDLGQHRGYPVTAVPCKYGELAL